MNCIVWVLTGRLHERKMRQYDNIKERENNFMKIITQVNNIYIYVKVCKKKKMLSTKGNISFHV